MQEDLSLYGNQLNWMTTYWTIGLYPYRSFKTQHMLTPKAICRIHHRHTPFPIHSDEDPPVAMVTGS